MAIKALYGFDHYAQNDPTWVTKAPAGLTRYEVASTGYIDTVVSGWVRTLAAGSVSTFDRIQFALASFFTAPADTISFGMRIRCDVPAGTTRVIYTNWGSNVDFTTADIPGGAVAGKVSYVEFIYKFSTNTYTWKCDGVVIRSAVAPTGATRAVVLGVRTIAATAERWAFKDVVVSDDQDSPVGPMGPGVLVLQDAATGTYTFQKSPSQLSLRRLGGYAMAKQPAQLSARQIRGYAMCTPFTPLPAGLTGQQAVLAMIVAKSKTIRPTTDFTIDASTVLTGDPLFNSRVKATATSASGLFGSYTFRYNRVALSRMGLTSSSFDLGTATTIYGLLPAISAAAGITLTTDDVEDGVIGAGDLTVTLKAKASSWWFIPGNTLVIGKTLPSINVPISSDTIDW
jgi:hypothetical protein